MSLERDNQIRLRDLIKACSNAKNYSNMGKLLKLHTTFIFILALNYKTSN